MNKSVTSKVEILETCRELVAKHGLAYINMRAVARSCGVAAGALYHYFPSKNDLLLATIESVWKDIFQLDKTAVETTDSDSFINCLNEYFLHLKAGISKYPNFFNLHALSFSAGDRDRAQKVMQDYLTQIKGRMAEDLQKDKKIKGGIFSENFSEDDFFEFILSNFISLLLKGQDDCKILLEIVSRTVY